MNARPRAAAVVCVVVSALAGCDRAPQASAPPLGRSIAASAPSGPVPVAASPAPVGDPPSERNGTIPAATRSAENTVARAAGVASTPQLALRHYALTYINWRAGGLAERERQLAAMSIGTAKLTDEQTATARSATAALIANDVANTGQIVATTPGQGPYLGEWVVVTLEHTTGAGAYAGLPTAPHITLAHVHRLDGGWVVSAWNPKN